MRAARGYWTKYIGFALTGTPIVWLLEMGVPSFAPEVVHYLVDGFSSASIPTARLLLLATASRFGEAGSASIALRVPHLQNAAPGRGRRPHFALFYQIAFGQALVLAVCTGGLVFFGLEGIGRVALLITLYVSIGATLHTLVLVAGTFWLTPPRHPEESERTLGTIPVSEVMANNSSVAAINLTFSVANVVAALIALLGSNLLLALTAGSGSTRVALVMALLALALAGPMAAVDSQ